MAKLLQFTLETSITLRFAIEAESSWILKLGDVIVSIHALKLFVSYAHRDTESRKDFLKHIAPLQNQGMVQIYDDSLLLPGDTLSISIDRWIEQADVFCALITADYLASKACMDELKMVLNVKRNHFVKIIPIIVDHCNWKDGTGLSDLLALPKDAKPVSTYSNKSESWNYIYEQLREIITQIKSIKDATFSAIFTEFLCDAGMFTKAHSKKTRVLLDDIFVSPNLKCYSELREIESTASLTHVIEQTRNYKKIIISGESQSGKSTCCKVLIQGYRTQGLLPVYIDCAKRSVSGLPAKLISDAFAEQYENLELDDLVEDYIVPVFDDFHLIRGKEKLLGYISKYAFTVMTVDDIFGLDLHENKYISGFQRMRLAELSPSARYHLIEKWELLSDSTPGDGRSPNDYYKSIDSRVEQVNAALGKILGNGVMPSFPFFVLSIVCSYEIFSTPLDQEITSQGHCYQAFVYMYLRKSGVRNDEIDIYVNILTELAFYFYSNSLQTLTSARLGDFIRNYKQKYNLPVDPEKVMAALQVARIVSADSFENYSFKYVYIYYFFVAKYLAENIESTKMHISEVLSSLEREENAYIAVFLSHHSRSDYILDEIVFSACLLFEKYSSSTLDKEELEFFDEQAELLTTAVLPPAGDSPRSERARRLAISDEIESECEDPEKFDSEGDEYFSVQMQIRKSIKTVEVLGSIIKNRSGSLKRERLLSIIEEGIGIQLRFMSFFFDLIGQKNRQEEIIQYLEGRIEKYVAEKQNETNYDRVPLDEQKRIARVYFWNLNFLTVYALINKAISALGSDKLNGMICEVCENNDTPARLLISHGSQMWHSKNIRIDDVSKLLRDSSMSTVAKRILEFLVVNHCSMHVVHFRDRQRIEALFPRTTAALKLEQAKLRS